MYMDDTTRRECANTDPASGLYIKNRGGQLVKVRAQSTVGGGEIWGSGGISLHSCSSPCTPAQPHTDTPTCATHQLTHSPTRSLVRSTKHTSRQVVIPADCLAFQTGEALEISSR